MGGWGGFDAAKEEERKSDEDDNGGEDELAGEVGTGEEDVGEPGESGERRERIEPQPEGTREIGLGSAQNHDADVLREELEQKPDDDHGGDDVGEREEAEERCGRGKREQGDVGEAAGGMEAGEDAEEVAVARRRRTGCGSSRAGGQKTLPKAVTMMRMAASCPSTWASAGPRLAL